jgi:predicted transcriptional regulator
MRNKKQFIVIVGIMFIFILQGCGGVNLSDKEASSIIIDHEKLPQVKTLYFAEIHEKAPLFQDIKRLVKEGYVVKVSNPNRKIGGTIKYRITEKGTPFFKKLEWRSWLGGGGYWNAEIYGYEVTLKAIKEILIDKDTKTAEVTAIFQSKYTDAALTFRKTDPNHHNFTNYREETYERKYTMKKWDKGWRIE